MIRKEVYNILFLLLAIFVLLACKKDEKDEVPSITLNAPVAYASYVVGDTMPIIGSVSHHSILESVRIVIKDDNNSFVTVPKYLYPNSFTYQINLDYIIDAQGLETGDYTLVITASDGSRIANLFRTIRLQGPEKEFQQLVILTRPNMLKTYVYGLNDNGVLSNFLNTNYGFTSSELVSGKRKLFLVKGEPSKLFAYDLDDIVEDEWIAASPPFAVFNDVFYSDQLTYVSTSNGDIKGLNQLGSTTFITQQNLDTIPVLLHRHNNLILSYNVRRGGPERFIRQNYLATGDRRYTYKIPFTPAGIFTLDDEFCLLFGNEQDRCAVYHYHPDENYLLEQRDFPTGEIVCVASLSPDYYILAHTDGLLLYDAQNNTSVDYLAGFETELMAYDVVRNLLYCASGQRITVIRVDNAEIIGEFDIPYPIYALHVQYNI